MSDKLNMNLEMVSNPKPKAELVYQEIKRGILRGTFSPGELLPEDQLTVATGASRTPVREALMRLQGDGLVQIIPRKGARVVDLNKEELDALVEAREAFELFFFNRAVKNVPRQEFKQAKEHIVQISKDIETLTDDSEHLLRKRDEYLDVDFKLHRRIVEAADNKTWLKSYDAILDRVKLYSYLAIKRHPKLFEPAIKEHLAILDALLSGDFSEAKWLLRQHIREFRTCLTP